MTEDKVLVWICLEVSRPNSVTHLERKPMFEWYVVKYGFKSIIKGHHVFQKST